MTGKVADKFVTKPIQIIVFSAKCIQDTFQYYSLLLKLFSKQRKKYEDKRLLLLLFQDHLLHSLPGHTSKEIHQ